MQIIDHVENQAFVRFTTDQMASGEVRQFELTVPFTTQDPNEMLSPRQLVLDDSCAGDFKIVDVRVDGASILPAVSYGSTSPQVDVFRMSFRRVGPGGKANRRLKVVLENVTKTSLKAKGYFWFARTLDRAAADSAKGSAPEVPKGEDSDLGSRYQEEEFSRRVPGIIWRTGKLVLRLARIIVRVADEYEQFMHDMNRMREVEDELDGEP